jgi:DNA mismatch repair protein MutL
MPRIQQLSTTLVNQIAAGEVVERPASVVKELLENAVDAGGSRIDVEVAQGGIDLIRVVDNGSGIAADDLALAFASHATSKLATVDDLFRIGTLGFRGAALASIGSIALVTLQSRPPDQPVGAEITCHGGQLSPARAWNGAAGTRVEVRHLFYNTPARRKFLKAAGTEMGHVTEAFTRQVLAHLGGVQWTLHHNGRPVYEVPNSMGLLDRIGLFFGSDVANSLYMVEAEQEPVVLGGYVGDPSCDQGNSQLQYLFLNGRWVRDRGLFQAVQEAYRGLLMTGRYPVAFLFLQMPPEQVDVNVHPTKAEVRFRDRDTLYQLVSRVVRERLQRADLTAKMLLDTRKTYLPPSEINVRSLLPADRPASGTSTSKERPPTPRAMPAAARSTATDLQPPTSPQQAAASAKTSPVPPPVTAPELFPLPGNAEPPVTGKASSVRAIQVLDCYFVVEVPPDEVLFIDQHALHERILFEQLRQRFASGTLETQRLLTPEPVDLPAAQAALVREHREALAQVGLAVEDFGGNTVLLTGYPAMLDKRSPRVVFQGVVDHLVAHGQAPDREQLLQELLSVVACHAAVRAGDRLTPAEIEALLAQRDLAENSHHCPHGRPTSLRFSRRDLDRQFRRT